MLPTETFLVVERGAVLVHVGNGKYMFRVGRNVTLDE